MSPLLPNRDLRRRKGRVGEGADGDRNQAWDFSGLPIDRRAAKLAEAESQGIAGVRDAREFFRRSGGERHVFPAKPGLRAKDASGSPLTFEAMAEGDARRLAFAGKRQSSAMAGGAPDCH